MAPRNEIEARALEIDTECRESFSKIVNTENINFRVNYSKNSNGNMIPSTISFLAISNANLNKKVELLERVRRKFRPEKYENLKSKDGPSYAVELSNNNFANAVTFKFHLKRDGRKGDYGENPSVKFFINGKFQVTGPKSATELVGILHHTCDILSQILNFNIEVEEFSINMINTDFYVCYPDSEGIYHDDTKKKSGYEIDKRKLCNVFKSQRLHSNVPQNHQSVEVNIKRSFSNGIVTIYIFPTSKIIITGGKCGADIKNAYSIVMDILDKRFGTYFVGNRTIPNKIVETIEVNVDVTTSSDNSTIDFDMTDEEWNALPKLPPPTPLHHNCDIENLPPPSPVYKSRLDHDDILDILALGSP